MNNLKYIALVFLIYVALAICVGTNKVEGAGKIYTPKEPKYGEQRNYTRQQNIQRGTKVLKKYTTCRLMKRIQSRSSGLQACIYRGGNKTYELMYEKNCPRQYKCVYNPGQPEPNIDSVVDSLNSIAK
tara:strand:+ start:152 stop:535 length:384 start_codon:yes stop_codon:yes gene_type:complete